MKTSEYEEYLDAFMPFQGGKVSNEEVPKAFISSEMVLSNLYQEIEMDTDTVNCHEDVNYAQDNVQLHSHSFYEIIYCKSGNVQYLLGANRYRIHRGDIVFVPPGISHRPLYLEQLAEPYSRYVMWIHPKFIRSIQEKLHFTPWSEPAFFCTQDSNWEYLGTYFQFACREAAVRQEGYEACICAIAVQFLIHFTRACKHSKPIESLSVKREPFDDLIGYIEDHLMEKLTLKSVAGQFYMSERAISRLFNEKMETSFYKYVTQRRLIAAKVLILRGEPLENVGMKVGFTDYSTFYRAFRQAFAISPKQFKQMQKEQEYG